MLFQAQSFIDRANAETAAAPDHAQFRHARLAGKGRGPEAGKSCWRLSSETSGRFGPARRGRVLPEAVKQRSDKGEDRRSSTFQQPVIVCVNADPEPGDGIALEQANRAIMNADTHGVQRLDRINALKVQ